MRSSVTLDQRIRAHVSKTEQTYRVWKALALNNENNEKQVTAQASINTPKLLRDLRPHLSTKVRRRCVLTGRGRGVYRRFRRSRIKVREMALRGDLACVRKRSW